jgi:hypothetical protein
LLDFCNSNVLESKIVDGFCFIAAICTKSIWMVFIDENKCVRKINMKSCCRLEIVWETLKALNFTSVKRVIT